MGLECGAAEIATRPAKSRGISLAGEPPPAALVTVAELEPRWGRSLRQRDAAGLRGPCIMSVAQVKARDT